MAKSMERYSENYAGNVRKMTEQEQVIQAYPDAKVIAPLQIETGKPEYFVRIWEKKQLWEKKYRDIYSRQWWYSKWNTERVTLGTGPTKEIAWSEAWKTVQKKMLVKFEQ